MAFIADGYQTLVQMGPLGAPVFSIREIEVKPPVYDGGGALDTTTMRSWKFRQKQPRALINCDTFMVTGQWDPVYYSTLVNQIHVNQIMFIMFPDFSAISFFGWLDKFEAKALKEGEFSTAEFTFILSNTDTSGNAVGQPIVYVAPTVAAGQKDLALMAQFGFTPPF